ncbi:MAG: ComEC/Rec2 family competence protein, partial [Gaiellaceae bacterium]
AWTFSRPGEGPLGPAPQGLRVTVLDVGQGDSILVQAPGANILVDQAEPRANVATRLRALGVEALDLLVFSHPQRDHLGGAPAVIERFRVGSIVDPGLDVESSDYDEALARAEERGVPVVTARQGMSFRAGGLRVDVLWPQDAGSPADDPNDLSVVLLVSYGAVDVLLTGDAESPVLSRLDLPEIEVLKVSHHGSADEGLSAVLERIQPAVAVISAGEGNRFGHPHPDTLAALRARDVVVYRTDAHGDVTLESLDGRSITVATQR